MRLRVLKSGFESITLREINEIENTINYKLPQEYIDFILKHNACYTQYDIFRFKKPDEFEEGVFHDKENWIINISDIKNATDFLIFEDENNKGKKYLHIAEIDGSQAIYLSLNQETYGQIYYADLTHDNRFIHIANNLEDFLNSFEVNPDYEDTEDEE